MHRRRVSRRVVQLIKFAAKHWMLCGNPWDSLKCELRAYAGLLPLLKGDWTNSHASEKGWFFATRTAPHLILSSRVTVVFWNVLVVAVRSAVSVPGNTLSNNWGLPIGRLKISFMRWNMKRFQTLPKFVQSCFLWMLVKDIGMCVYFSCSTIWHWFFC